MRVPPDHPPPDADSEEAARGWLREVIRWLEQRLMASSAEDRNEDAVEFDKKAAAITQSIARLEDERDDLPIHAVRAWAALSEFEERCLWLAVAAQVDRHVGELVAWLSGDSRQRAVTPWVCLRLFCTTRHERLERERAFDAAAPLFDLGLLAARPADGQALSSDRLDATLVPASFLRTFLLGRRVVSDEAAPFARRIRPALGLDQVACPPAERAALRAIGPALEWRPALADPVCGEALYDFQQAGALLLTGSPGSGKSLLARALAGERGRALIEVDADRLATLSDPQIIHILDTLFREAAFTGEWLLFDGCDSLLRRARSEGPLGDQRLVFTAFRAALRRWPVGVIITAESPDAVADSVRDRLFLHHELPSIGRDLAGLAWQLNVPGAVELDRDVDFADLAENFALTGRGLQNAINLAVRSVEGDGPLRQPTLEAAARAQQSSGLGEFARRTWVSRPRADLVAAERVATGVDAIIATERVRENILQQWGLAARMHKGLGLVCLFDGEPGTGKTLAAEVIASELCLPLYTVNVSNVVSKWIGETEKNLQRIFDDAQRNRCVLLFDEADSLFARRTEVTRSVDRYANMEVGLLLQLVENYRGLVILTTNLRESLDPAFSRRFAFKITFEFPDAESRRTIWERLLPPGRLDADLDVEDLAWSYELAGGSIRTVVLRAAFRAAVEGTRITREIVSECAVEECRALGKLVRDPSGLD